MRILAAVSSTGLTIGLAASAFGFGFRHGIDWDHIAAITDIASSQESPRKALGFGTLYALGHAAVVFVIGVLAIVLGERVPPSVDRVMSRVVGVTLLLLGVYVFYSLIRHGRDFRMRSRWMLVFSGAHRSYRWARALFRRSHGPDVEHVHHHPALDPFIHHDAQDEIANGRRHGRTILGRRLHAHGHRHRAETDPFMNYGPATAFGVGMIHGIGAETPTQVLIFLAAAGAGGTTAGLTVLILFLVGLFAANGVVTLSSAYGLLAASKRFALYASVAVMTGVVSLAIGAMFVLGKETFLPALFGG